jgi:hypothetical protein
LFAAAVGHNSTLNGVNVVDVADNRDSGPVVREVSLPGWVTLAKEDCFKAAGFCSKTESSNAGKEVEMCSHGFIGCSAWIFGRTRPAGGRPESKLYNCGHNSGIGTGRLHLLTESPQR